MYTTCINMSFLGCFFFQIDHEKMHRIFGTTYFLVSSCEVLSQLVIFCWWVTHLWGHKVHRYMLCTYRIPLSTFIPQPRAFLVTKNMLFHAFPTSFRSSQSIPFPKLENCRSPGSVYLGEQLVSKIPHLVPKSPACRNKLYHGCF